MTRFAAQPPKHRRTFHRRRVLFVCSGNACRSQIAEGWARARFGDRVDAFSAGVESHGLDALAVRVMAEVGIDLSGHRSKSLAAFDLRPFDLVVTLSERAELHLRTLPNAPDTVHFSCASAASRTRLGSPSLRHYRKLRDELHDIVSLLIGSDSRTHANAVAKGCRRAGFGSAHWPKRARATPATAGQLTSNPAAARVHPAVAPAIRPTLCRTATRPPATRIPTNAASAAE